MKRLTKRPIVITLLAVAILVVAANAWFAIRAVDNLLQSEQGVEHTWQVIDEVERVMGSVKDAETGSRGYLLTGDESYLATYNTGTQALRLELDTLQHLTADNAAHQQRVHEIRAIMEERLSLLAQGIAVRRGGEMDSVRSTVLSGTGRLQMDRLRTIADQMEQDERRLLQIRTASARSNDRRTTFAIGLASCLDLLLILFMLRYLRREQGLRIHAEEQALRLAAARAESDARAAEVRRLNETLEESVRSRTAELETTNRELEAFSYSVSHDLRAPLRTIDGFSLALEEDYAAVVDEAGRDYIRRVRSGVQRMGQLIDALLQLSRITRAEIVPQLCNLSQIAETVVEDLKAENPAHTVYFEIEKGLTAFADPALVRVALENLLGNAVKFSSKVTYPHVTFGWDKREKAWFVKDNGAGFDMHYADKLFNAFNRLHGDKDFKGSGIGLATVARVIRRHHGRIWAYSTVDHGAIFWFTLG